MSASTEIADRRIRAGQEAGLFDGLEGAGKPIRDIDRVRPPGWWAMRLAEEERSRMRREDQTDNDMVTAWRRAAVERRC